MISMGTRVIDLIKKLSTEMYGDDSNVPTFLTDDNQIMPNIIDWDNMRNDVNTLEDRAVYKCKYEPIVLVLPSDRVFSSILVGSITFNANKTITFMGADDIDINSGAGDSSYSKVMNSPYDPNGKKVRAFSVHTVRLEDIKRIKYTIMKESLIQISGQTRFNDKMTPEYPGQRVIQNEPFDWLDTPLLSKDDIIPSFN